MCDDVCAPQTKPPAPPTDRRTGSLSWDSVTRSIRSSKGQYCVKVKEQIPSGFVFLIVGFCFVFFSPQISVQLLVHKIQSPQEWEALQALTVCTDRLFYFNILSRTKVSECGFVRLPFPRRFLRLARRTVGEDFTMKLENLGFWMSWLKSFPPKWVTWLVNSMSNIWMNGCFTVSALSHICCCLVSRW